MPWERPASVAVPTVWSRFDGLKPMADGRVPAFWVQCVRPEDDDAVVDMMERHFLREEEMNATLGVAADAASVAAMRARWRRLLAQRVSLAAWAHAGADGPRLVACNLCAIKRRGSPKITGPTPPIQKLYKAVFSLVDRVDVFEVYGVEYYLGGVGLTTLPEFRGQGLGLELLRARVPLCRAVGIPLTATVFTGIGSQKQSARAGFELLAEQSYADYRDDGEAIFSSVKAPSFQYKALAIK